MAARIIVLNGPPGCGKDTIADWLVENGYAKVSFKDSLYEFTAKKYALPLSCVWQVCNDRDKKEIPHKWFNGRSPREALIHVSEDIIKPHLGKDFFGKSAAASVLLNSKTDKFVFSDGGFLEEIAPLTKIAPVTVIRLYREGFDFSNDSRSYIANPLYPGPRAPYSTWDLMLLTGQIGKAVNDVYRIVKKAYYDIESATA